MEGLATYDRNGRTSANRGNGLQRGKWSPAGAVGGAKKGRYLCLLVQLFLSTGGAGGTGGPLNYSKRGGLRAAGLLWLADSPPTTGGGAY